MRHKAVPKEQILNSPVKAITELTGDVMRPMLKLTNEDSRYPMMIDENKKEWNSVIGDALDLLLEGPPALSV
ncbi:hypothetical protein PIB30_006708 [Stylosanthes scabra]|uniref:Uncharacterized protein n=1 Tax=Stylosanthes scabra TaxID=79078 RepID=A0ABU6S4X7_9FABA|nr:hypothetical protein [Stylosanthes scabra]